MTKQTLILALSACTLCAALSACDKKPERKGPSPTAAAPQAGAAAAPAAPQPEVKVEKEVYTYDPKGRRDPFAALTELAKERPVKRKGAAPIEDVDVDEIKVIAIAWDSKQYYAMVTLPDGKSYTVRKGMTLGIYGGKVREITKDSVIVTEQIKDYKGQSKTKDTILKLRKEEEE